MSRVRVCAGFLAAAMFRAIGWQRVVRISVGDVARFGHIGVLGNGSCASRMG